MQSFDPNAASTQDSGIYGLPYDQDQSKVVLIPVPFDATTSYKRGAALGPEVILKASRQVDLFDLETGRPYEAGIFMEPLSETIQAWNETARNQAEPIIREGGRIESNPELSKNLETVNATTTQMNQWVKERTALYLRQNKIVGIVGGDHSVPFGAISAYAEHYKNLGVLHIDAHADLRNAYEGFLHSHASIMHNVVREIPEVTRLVQVGIRDLCEEEQVTIDTSNQRIILHSMPSIRRKLFDGTPYTQVCLELIQALPQNVYISFDIDGLDPSLCPNTGTPVPGGLSFYEVTHLFSLLVTSGRTIVGFDLNEVAPNPQSKDEWDGNVGARILYKLIGFTLLSQQQSERSR